VRADGWHVGFTDLTGAGRGRAGRPGHALHRCADAGVPELERLATTISTWWPYVEALVTTGITNAASEGFNRVVTLDARNAYGYRNPDNQRVRTHTATGCCCTATRMTRCGRQGVDGEGPAETGQGVSRRSIRLGCGRCSWRRRAPGPRSPRPPTVP